MDFEYTPEQLQLRREVRDFATAEIGPHVLEWDEAQTFPLEVIKKLGKLGYLGAIFPEEYGGAGLGYVEYSIIIEELSRVDGSVGVSSSPPIRHSVVTTSIRLVLRSRSSAICRS